MSSTADLHAMGQSISTPVADTLLDHTPPWPDDERGSLRWVVNVHHWRPRAIEWRFLSSLIPHAEMVAAEKMHKVVDRKRALVSRLMQRRCVAIALGVADEKVVVARTKGNKPFDATPRAGERAAERERPNFNFNVSHEGSFVVLASDPMLLIGVDVAAPFELREGPSLGDFAKLKDTFEAVVAADEWELIESEESEAERVAAFRRQWSRKESFVKARGDGLAFALQRVRFRPCNPLQPPHPLDFLPPKQPGARVKADSSPPSASPSEADASPPSASPPAPAVASPAAAPSVSDDDGDGALRRLLVAGDRAGAHTLLKSRGVATIGERQRIIGAASATADAKPAAAAAASGGASVDGAVGCSSSSTACDAAEVDELESLPGCPMLLAPPRFSLVHVDDDEGAIGWAGLTDSPSHEWRTTTHVLEDNHIVSVTRGPVSKAVDANGVFRRTFGRPTMPDGELRARLAQPPVPFRSVTIRELVPPSQRAAYDAIILAQANGVPLVEMPERPPYRPAAAPPAPPFEAATENNQTPSWFNPENTSRPRISDPFGGDLDGLRLAPARTYSNTTHNGSKAAAEDEEGCAIA